MSLANQIKPKSISERAIEARDGNGGDKLDLTLIRTDGGTQSRASLFQNVIDEYASAIGEGARFPPVVVFYDGETYWLADGFHRHAAHKQSGTAEIAVDVRQGKRRDAILHSVGANEAHGLRRTNEDKRRAVLTLLNDPEWSKWSDREIARQCQVDGKTVARLREGVTADFRSDEPRTYTTKHGTTATMDTSAIGPREFKLDTAPVRAFDPHQGREIEQQYKALRAEKIETARNERLEKLATISAGNADLGVEQRYPIIYADPPWRYENPPMGGTNRSIENHYPTMTLDEICALPVSDLATDDAMLYLWATAPKLAECMKVIEAWGFQYRTNIVWDKEAIGMGYHARNQHEILLIAKRGSIPPPEAGKQPASVHRERRGEHSAKPHFYYEMIEAAYPGLPKIELFSRTPREGWESWGNQAEALNAA